MIKIGVSSPVVYMRSIDNTFEVSQETNVYSDIKKKCYFAYC